MISRKELEELDELIGKMIDELIGKMTDEQWAENLKIMSSIEDEMWEEDHPLDD